MLLAASLWRAPPARLKIAMTEMPKCVAFSWRNALLLGGCASAPAVEPFRQQTSPFSMLLFGDHGYDLDYLEADERNPPLTLEQAIAANAKNGPRTKGRRRICAIRADPAARYRWLCRGQRHDARSEGDAELLAGPRDATRQSCSGDNIYPNGPTGGADGVSDAKRFDDISC